MMIAAGDVRMVKNTLERPLKLLGVGPDRRGAAVAMWERDDSVYIGWKALIGKAALHQVRGMSRTIAGRNHGNIVPGSYSPILADEPTKRSRGLLRKGRRSVRVEIVIDGSER